MSFPKNFVWGAAAASYQIEGAWDADGKAPSVWDMLTRQPGKVWQNHNGDVACDHYHLYQDDVALMKEIGLQAYRLSVSWPRVLPDGVGAVNQAGLDFYDRLVDELLANKIEPWVTLFHWDFPYALFLRGGWLNPKSPEWFAEYAQIVVDRLSDRVTRWMTLNEPQCFIGMGHLSGDHAPGLKLGLTEVIRAGHHCLLAHGRGVQVIRERAKKKSSVGWAPIGTLFFPASEAKADVDAARELAHGVEGDNFWASSWWSDPAILGHYPEAGLKAYGAAMPKFPASDFRVIQQPLDFYGCNWYHGTKVKAGPDGKPVVVTASTSHPHTMTGWKVAPEILYWGPKFMAERYKRPIVITENGVSMPDWVCVDGKVHDSMRIDFLTRYLRELDRAIEDGVDVQGYFQWSIMDNFEWQEGYKQRFGLVHVDYDTQKRTLKDSAYWYREVISTNGSSLK